MQQEYTFFFTAILKLFGSWHFKLKADCTLWVTVCAKACLRHIPGNIQVWTDNSMDCCWPFVQK